MQCCRNYSAVFLHLLTFLYVGPQILIQRTSSLAMQHGKNLLECLIQPLQPEGSSACAAGIYFPSPCWEKFLNGVKEWGAGWEELPQHPVVGCEPLPDDVGPIKTDVVPNDHILWQVISNLTPLLFRDEIPRVSTFTFSHLADALIQSDLKLVQGHYPRGK